MNEDTIFDVNYGLEQLSVSMLGSGEVEVKAVFGIPQFYSSTTVAKCDYGYGNNSL